MGFTDAIDTISMPSEGKQFFPLNAPKFHSVVFGNIVEQGIEQTWKGQAYQSFREQLASARPPDVCCSCSIYSGTF